MHFGRSIAHTFFRGEIAEIVKLICAGNVLACFRVNNDDVTRFDK